MAREQSAKSHGGAKRRRSTRVRGGTRAKIVVPVSTPELSELRESPVPATPKNGALPSRAGGDQRGKYVYCVVHSEKSLTFGPIGIGIDPTEVHTVSFRDVAAVVSDTPIELYEPTRQNVLAHERVNETVMRNHTVIPMSFGTVFKTREDIHQLLRSAYDAFKDVLVKMEDKLEYGLKVLWDHERVVEALEREN
jgi:hypothetical protein